MKVLPVRWAATASCVLGLLVAGCAHAPYRVGATELLDDARFAAPEVPVDPAQVFALSSALKRYADRELAPANWRDRRRRLIDALYRSDGLQLNYDGAFTRSASEAFEQRAGNCLSLVIMTAALARYLELPVQFQSVRVEDSYARDGGLVMAAGHVNLVLGTAAALRDAREAQWLTIDFLPQANLGHQVASRISESTVTAMFMNNRAAEAMAAGRIDQSYWWAREALRQDPAFLAGANTLAVVYMRAGELALAERALRYVLERDDNDVSALSNYAQLLRSAGRSDEAEAAAARLARLQSEPPFWFLDRGREAIARRDFVAARDLLLRELRRQPDQHEVHYQLAIAYAGLNDAEAAARELAQAVADSPTAGQQALYAGKLERLRHQLQQ